MWLLAAVQAVGEQWLYTSRATQRASRGMLHVRVHAAMLAAIWQDVSGCVGCAVHDFLARASVLE